MFIAKLGLRNYKSIAACELALGPLNFLIGPNGSGKSNCLDSLRFVAEALRTLLDHALRERGSIRKVRRRPGGHPNHFGVRLDFQLPPGRRGIYAFQAGAKSSGGFGVQREKRLIRCDNTAGVEHHYLVKKGRGITTSAPIVPAASPDRLHLVAASGLPRVRNMVPDSRALVARRGRFAGSFGAAARAGFHSRRQGVAEPAPAPWV